MCNCSVSFSSQSDQDPDLIRQKNEVNPSLLDESVESKEKEKEDVKKGLGMKN